MRIIPKSLQSADQPDTAYIEARSRGETAHRLQVGLLSLAAMILLVGVADMIMDRAQQSEDAVPPAAAPTINPSPSPTQNSALENAGVVPDLPDDATEEPLPEGPVVPEQGNGIPEE